MSIIARLKPGVTLEQATAETSSLAREFAKAYPDTNKQ
jgi:DNA primase